MWRWDQGRLDYFNFKNLKMIARSLTDLKGINLNNDSIRVPLQTSTGLPFAPSSYTLWRNYARVFGCSLLATRIGNVLATTELCEKISNIDTELFDADDYFCFIIPRFYFPSPVFQGYNTSEEQIFPFCTVLKLLLAKFKMNQIPKTNVEEIFSKLIGNCVKGVEDSSFYIDLPETQRTPRGDENRQVREMLIFISQFSLLKWYGNNLYLDLLDLNEDTNRLLEDLSTPIIKSRKSDRVEELLALGKVESATIIPYAALSGDIIRDANFTEGKRVRISHLRVERSPRLRNIFLKSLPKPILCDSCNMNPQKVYHWTDSIIEVHHMLPLSSTISVNGRGVTLSDLVAVCANCHKSIHAYYKKWLNENNLYDFTSEADAKNAYGSVKHLIQKGIT